MYEILKRKHGLNWNDTHSKRILGFGEQLLLSIHLKHLHEVDM